jgi:hypothetical protein
MVYKQARLRPSFCPDGSPHYRRIATPDGGLKVGSVCIRCGEVREYKASEPDLPTEFSIKSGERWAAREADTWAS